MNTKDLKNLNLGFVDSLIFLSSEKTSEIISDIKNLNEELKRENLTNEQRTYYKNKLRILESALKQQTIIALKTLVEIDPIAMLKLVGSISTGMFAHNKELKKVVDLHTKKVDWNVK